MAKQSQPNTKQSTVYPSNVPNRILQLTEPNTFTLKLIGKKSVFFKL